LGRKKKERENILFFLKSKKEQKRSNRIDEKYLKKMTNKTKESN